MAQAEMLFPQDFLWGTATSSFQVEGNNKNSDWWAWEQENGRVLHNHKSELACNWWQNVEADLDMVAKMGNNAHRLSLEWSRIEPQPGEFSQEALDRYREILQAMLARGLEPMVTLHHFSNPIWLVEKNDFNSDIVVDYFQRYCAKVVAALGDLIPKWITINEPMLYVLKRYLNNDFPTPHKQGWGAAMEAVGNLLRCHAAAYHTIKETYPQAQVGVAKNSPLLQARPDGNILDKIWAKRASRFFNDLWMDAMVNGRLHTPISRQKITHLADSFDFVGLNYYTRTYLKFPSYTPVYDNNNSEGNVYPAGLYKLIHDALRFKKPIYITANGLPDAGDRLRPSFILTHLREVWRAISFCFPVMGYYHWSLVDNFAWERGWTKRFGLIEIDPATQSRTLRKSGELYGEICHTNSISSDMAAKYAPQLLDTIFCGEAPKQVAR